MEWEEVSTRCACWGVVPNQFKVRDCPANFQVTPLGIETAGGAVVYRDGGGAYETPLRERKQLLAFATKRFSCAILAAGFRFGDVAT